MPVRAPPGPKTPRHCAVPRLGASSKATPAYNDTVTGLLRALTAPRDLFYGWHIVARGAVANALGGGIYQYGMAVFFLPITRDLELSRAQTSLIFSLSQAEAAVGGPPAGWANDKFGPRKVMTAATIIAGVGYLLLSQAASYELFIIIYLGLVSLAHNGGYGYAVSSAVNAWFVRKRALAFAITLSAFNVGSLMAPVLAYLMEHIGWRGAMTVAGVLLMVVMVPVSQGFVRSPEAVGLVPDGQPMPAAGSTAAAAVRDVNFTVKQAIRTRAFWGLTLATTLRLAVMNVVSLHFVPMMVWKGATEAQGAFLLSAMWISGIPLRLLLGYWGDRLPKTLIVSAGVFFGAASLLALQGAQELWHLVVFAALFAVMQGTIPLNWVMIGDYFGRKNYATMRGFMSIAYTGGTMGMPVFAGAMYDATQSYKLVVWIMIALFLVAGAWFAFLRAPAPPAVTGEAARAG